MVRVKYINTNDKPLVVEDSDLPCLAVKDGHVFFITKARLPFLILIRRKNGKNKSRVRETRACS